MKIKAINITDKYLIIETDDGIRKMSKGFSGIDGIIAKCKDFKERQCLVEYSTWGDYEKSEWFSDIWEVNSKPNTTETSDQNIFPLGKKFKKQKSQKIYGPPGTGKTTTLIEIVKKAVDKGAKPEDIAFVAFTNEAANVAKDRVSKAFPDLGSISFPNFSTLHAISTRIGGTGGAKLMEEKDFKSFDSQIACSTEWTSLGDATSAIARQSHVVLDGYSLSINRQTKMDYKKFASDLTYKTNNTCSILSEFFSKDFTDVRNNLAYYCEKYVEEFLSYKNKNHLISFDDVISKVADPKFQMDRIPTFELLIIDEAQDLSRNQWDFAVKLIKNAKVSYIAGDDDQAIMENYGSDPSVFVNLKTTKKDRILEQSFRVPKSSHSYVNSGVMELIKSIPGRAKKVWTPKEKPGSLGNPSKLSPISKQAENKHVVENFLEIYRPEIKIEDLLRIVENDWQNSKTKSPEIDLESILDTINQGQNIVFKPGSAEKIRIILKENLNILRKDYVFDQNLEDKIINEISNNELSEVTTVLIRSLLRKGFEKELIPFIEIDKNEKSVAPSWLIMAPTKPTGEKISTGLEEKGIPHFYRNKPILNADKEKTLIRVQTIHISKGAEADNTAIVISSKGDVNSLAKNPRLAYVALTRARIRMFPRVVRDGLMGEQNPGTISFNANVEIYNKMFPKELKVMPKPNGINEKEID